MTPLLATILPALAQIERERAPVIVKPSSESAQRKRRWRDDPVNRAIEAKRKREKYANRRNRK